MRRICVFCGSNKGGSASYSAAARELGKLLAEKKISLVYGGGNVGLMGIIADTVMNAGGEVIGVIPEALVAKEVAHRGLSELKTVKSMHERKSVMADLSDGFIALPGGFGTFEEFFEVVTWTQLGLHKKPCGILNVEGFFEPLIALVKKGTAEGFIRQEHADILLAASSPRELLRLIGEWKPPTVEKWLDKSRR